MYTYLSAVSRKSYKIFICASLFVQLFCGKSYGQMEVFNNIQSQFKNYSSQALQEKLFVHTDKSFYVTGEIIWFKVYNVDGNFNRPLNISKVAYIEVLNKDQKPVLQAKVALKDAHGNGSFFIPVSLLSGNYKLRAYTSWMKNFSPDFYFEKNITIVNSLKALAEKPVETVAPALDIQFFPEGGNLVNGLPGIVAFKVVDPMGKGVSFTGTVIDQDNNTVASFAPLQFGMGHFSFTPAAGKKYKAIIRLSNSSVIVNEFPAAYDQGYVMHLDDNGKDQLNVTVSTNINAPSQFFYLFVHSRQVIKIAEVHAVNDGKAVFVVDKNKLGDGISSFTVFNNVKQPVCERLYFKRPAGLHVHASALQDEYQSRKKVILNIDVQDDGKPANADMSMSVYRVDSLDNNQQNDIFSYLWLTSDLPGYIESPSYYVSNTSAAVDEATDNLMLTHGWRKFRWEEVLQDKAPSFEFIPEYTGHIISGKVTDKRTGLPAENITSYVSAPGIRFQVGGAVSNKKGQLQFDIKDFYGSNEIVVQTNYLKDSMYRLDILNPFAEKFSQVPIPAFDLAEDIQDDLVSRSVGTQVQNAFQTDNLQKFDAPDMLDSTAFYGTPDRKFFLDEYTRFNTMEEVMREYIAGVATRKHQQKFHFKILDDSHRQFFDEDPLILLDGVPVFDADKIIATDPLKVKKIEVVSRKYFLGPIIASGIVSYTTYKGDLEGFQFDPNVVVLEYEGLQLQREFYAPVYETEKQIKNRMPDFRNLLYWSPNLITNQEGRKQVIFYTSDQQGKYIAVIQGISPDGKAGSYSFSFDVAK